MGSLPIFWETSHVWEVFRYTRCLPRSCLVLSHVGKVF
jgi:hypothetical protein